MDVYVKIFTYNKEQHAVHGEGRMTGRKGQSMREKKVKGYTLL